MLRLLLFLSICLVGRGEENSLQKVDDDELDKLIKEEQYVVALFCEETAVDTCEEYEGELSSIREDYIDMMQGDAWLVKLVNSKLINRYSPTPVSVGIVMFRSGLPVLYDGPANGEVMIDTFLRYKDPAVQELTDTTFEHLTQAASGATTGDWLVLFYTDECELCTRLTATLESVAAKHKGRINVARVNKQT
ncbi:uncharacterized protein LOC111716301, partial [Eurytemora carolleeae]|uniref:uncharacterized protein LOC111716301 n=1 Tax=Eurytemora carolleeae TaxID=1294199 RepID=UPI000C765B1D